MSRRLSDKTTQRQNLLLVTLEWNDYTQFLCYKVSEECAGKDQAGTSTSTTIFDVNNTTPDHRHITLTTHRSMFNLRRVVKCNSHQVTRELDIENSEQEQKTQ